MDERRARALERLTNALKNHREADAQMTKLRKEHAELNKTFEKTERDLDSLQRVGQLIGEVLKMLTPEKFIVNIQHGGRWIVGCRKNIPRELLKPTTRVTLDMTTKTIMKILPREIDPTVYSMIDDTNENQKVTFQEIGGLNEKIRELKEVIELPLINPTIFKRVGIKAPKGVLLYGPPGTGKTLLARATAASIDAKFLKVVASGIVDKYIGESARMVRQMFAYARDHEPCIIFIDEIDAIGGKRFSEGTSSDREIQRTLMELLNQMDGFDELGQVKVIMATNRPDVLDPALLRPGRLDRKIEIPLPNDQGRLAILKIHSKKVKKDDEIDFDAIVKLSDGMNGADLRNIVTEAGLEAIRNNRPTVTNDDFIKAARKQKEAKKLEG
eukprot:CAMPEP_0117429874 /NCGR_PEP_ID=MMETSP0758-20121206/9419_1 /TAXON_ID=63605 /ORGANISM="Percolomonas cosmopolitus, Strain AE-1 (ATCC 50343)" /LENGTH=384 /DNA_ID=CAMNT_0005217341 /DNA_START=115 /DNA_END=1266 /DNA_ORIENTATION=-